MPLALRMASGALRANVRQGDVACRLEGLGFALVLPGVEVSSISEPLQRLHAALRLVRAHHNSGGEALDAGVGMGFWTPDVAPSLALRTALQETAAIRARERAGTAL